jgi:pyruvate/2-oxoglutarate dehydrogenase complex dihydrolipoamide dehydrogenase (E3) component
MAETVDVVVLGLGVGGETAAGRLAEAGLSVVGVEERLVGGECPYYACVPTKMMVRAANALAEARRVGRLAGHADVRSDWGTVAHRIRAEATDDWNDQVAVDRLVGKGMRFVRGTGRLAGPRRVVVRPSDGGPEQEYEARRGVVLAAGTAPAVPGIPGLTDTPYWTNRDAVTVTDLPASLLVLGGGPIGLEFAQVFARFGVPVEVVEAADRLLPGEEPEASRLIERVFADDGITVRTGATVRHIRYDWRGFTVQLAEGELTGGRLLVATGRRAGLADLGVETVGLDPNAKFVPVDERMRANGTLYALGDVTEHGGFTHLAMYQADIVVRDILGQPGYLADYRAVPRVTFTDPEIGSVGLTEARAADAGLTVRTGTTDLATSARGWIHGPGNDGLIKLVADADRGVLVGATSAGPSGGEVLAALTLAVHAQIPLDRLESMITAYPTFHRAIQDALAKLA